MEKTTDEEKDSEPLGAKTVEVKERQKKEAVEKLLIKYELCGKMYELRCWLR